MADVRWKDKSAIALALTDRFPVTDVSESNTDGYATPSDVLGLGLGQHTIWVPAVGMTSAATNGAADGSYETTTNAVNIQTKDFDDSTEEYIHFQIQMPKSWDESTLFAQFVWRTTATSGNCIWAIQAVAFANSDALDTAFGTAQTVTDAAEATAGDVIITDETSAMTVAGTPGAEELVAFRVYRDADNGSDTMTGDAQLLGVKIHYTINAVNDS